MLLLLLSLAACVWLFWFLFGFVFCLGVFFGFVLVLGFGLVWWGAAGGSAGG